jgi:glycosyltransferase involved in cell wall biosynthesis
MVTGLLWVLQQPTPYNVYLLNQLGTRLGMPSEVVYRWPLLPSHPWSALPARDFPWRIVTRPGARDRDLERRCASEEKTLVVFGGWRDATIRRALLTRVRARLPFAFWTDTPKTSDALPRRALNRVFVWFAGRAVTTLATGEPAVERYRVMGVPEERLENFPFVVDPDHLGSATTARSCRPSGGPVRFVLPARLIDRLKGQSVALEALRLARQALPGRGLELVIAGVGPDDAALRSQARRLGFGDAVRFAGWVEYPDVPALLGSADALILPSHWDPFPVVVIEGMAAGLPVLGSDACGSVRERVAHGENGLVHHAGDAGTLADHMCAVASNDAFRARLGRRALETSHAWGIDYCVGVLRTVLLARSRGAHLTTAPFGGSDPSMPSSGRSLLVDETGT